MNNKSKGFIRNFIIALLSVRGKQAEKKKKRFNPLSLFVMIYPQKVYFNRKKTIIQENPAHYAQMSTSAARLLVAKGQAEIISSKEYYANFYVNKLKLPICHLN
jgi:hypothetical protein